MKSFSRPVMLFLIPLLLLSCSQLGYYSQSIKGHLSIMKASRPIDAMLEDPEISDELKLKLSRVLEFRRFASEQLLLPDNDSYLSYADTGRAAAVWNVVAAPDDSLSPIQWCFVFVGCIPYRGYYDQAKAEAFADELSEQGLDVLTYGVPAYSTLGWFDDPMLNTLIDLPDWALAGIMFHELAHQQVYAEDDAVFNEAFAQMVEEEGERRWLAQNGTAGEREAFVRYRQRQANFQSLVKQTREELLDCYAAEQPRQARLECKQSTIGRMLHRYAELKSDWGGYAGYDHWFNPRPNNAHFVSTHTYRHFVPAFERLLAQCEGDLGRFYAEVGRLAGLSLPERHRILEELL